MVSEYDMANVKSICFHPKLSFHGKISLPHSLINIQSSCGSSDPLLQPPSHPVIPQWFAYNPDLTGQFCSWRNDWPKPVIQWQNLSRKMHFGICFSKNDLEAAMAILLVYGEEPGPMAKAYLSCFFVTCTTKGLYREKADMLAFLLQWSVIVSLMC